LGFEQKGCLIDGQSINQLEAWRVSLIEVVPGLSASKPTDVRQCHYQHDISTSGQESANMLRNSF